MDKFDQMLSLVREDSVDAPSTSVMPGTGSQFSSPPTNSEFTTLADLLNHKSGMDIGSTEKVTLGAPIQNILDRMAEAFLKIQDIRILFKNASKSPIYRDRLPEFEETFTTIDGLLKASQSNLKLVSKELDNLSLDSKD